MCFGFDEFDIFLLSELGLVVEGDFEDFFEFSLSEGKLYQIAQFWLLRFHCIDN